MSQESSVGSKSTKKSLKLGLRLKLVTAFTLAFTLIFSVLAYFIILYVTNEAQAKVVQQLKETAVGGAIQLDAESMQELLASVTEADTNNPFLQSGPSAEEYERLNTELMDIREIVPQSSPYTYFMDPNDGTLRWLTSWSALDPDPNFTVQYRQPVSDVVGETTYNNMAAGLSATTNEEPYYDTNGGWISTYTPVTNQAGDVVAGLGIDYPLTYVDETRQGAIAVVVPILVISYLVLLALVLLVSTWLTRPLKRLTAVTTRIADGEYDIDLSSVTDTLIPDELATLGERFALMVEKVQSREKKLTQEVTRLKVEIDSSKKEAAVAEILESDFFAGIAERAQTMRSRMKESAPDDDGLATT